MAYFSSWLRGPNAPWNRAAGSMTSSMNRNTGMTGGMAPGATPSAPMQTMRTNTGLSYDVPQGGLNQPNWNSMWQHAGRNTGVTGGMAQQAGSAQPQTTSLNPEQPPPQQL